jgi:hypothetical protein
MFRASNVHIIKFYTCNVHTDMNLQHDTRWLEQSVMTKVCFQTYILFRSSNATFQKDSFREDFIFEANNKLM